MSGVTAIEVGASLFPGARAWITYVWTPPFAETVLRRRLMSEVRDSGERAERVVREGEIGMRRLLDAGVATAASAGWDARPMLRQAYGAAGPRLARVADAVDADVVIIGAHGPSGRGPVVGAVDTTVHFTSRPVLIVPHPMFGDEVAATASGPVVVGWDGSHGAVHALRRAAQLLPGRDIDVVTVDHGASGAAAIPSDLPGAPGRRIRQFNAERSRGTLARTVSGALTAFADRHDAALLVVGSRGRSTTRELLMGSVAVSTVHTGHRPVMVVPAVRRAAPTGS